MATVDSAAAVGTSANSSTANATKKVMGKDEFMKMLIAQLKNQNPLNPLDGTDFAAQLAQFSTVEQIGNMSGRLDAMASSMNVMNNTQMASLIGSEITAKGNSVNVSGSTSTLTYDLSGPIQKGTIKIYNSSGLPVKTLEIGSQSAGLNTLTWDSSGLPSGTYTFDVAATDKNGVVVPASAMITGKISGISYKDGTPYITVNGQDIAFSSVISVKKPTTAA